MNCKRCGQLVHTGRHCPDCGFPIQISDLAGNFADDDPSPQHPVAEELPADEHPPGRALAWFRHAADAGYFADELSRLGWEADVSLDEVCSDGYWQVRYALRVPPETAAEAARALERLMQESADPEFADDGPVEEPAGPFAAVGARESGRRDEEDDWTGGGSSLGIVLVPVLLTLAAGTVAGGVAFWNGRKAPAARQIEAMAPAGWEARRFWRQVGNDPAPWTQTSRSGRTREIRFDADARAAILREDTTGDGVFDRELRITLPDGHH